MQKFGEYITEGALHNILKAAGFSLNAKTTKGANEYGHPRLGIIRTRGSAWHHQDGENGTSGLSLRRFLGLRTVATDTSKPGVVEEERKIPLKMSPYKLFDVVMAINGRRNSGQEPHTITIPHHEIKDRIRATQSWVRDKDGEGRHTEPKHVGYTKHPTGLMDQKGVIHLDDGHHRTTKAKEEGKPITVYAWA